jgi:hypothetical protein
MRRKKPEIGDLVRVPVEMNATCLVTATEGLMLRVQSLNRDLTSIYVRRDSVEVVSRANSR